MVSAAGASRKSTSPHLSPVGSPGMKKNGMRHSKDEYDELEVFGRSFEVEVDDTQGACAIM